MHCSEYVGGLEIIVKFEIEIAVGEGGVVSKLLGSELIKSEGNGCEVWHVCNGFYVHFVDFLSFSFFGHGLFPFEEVYEQGLADEH